MSNKLIFTENFKDLDKLSSEEREIYNFTNRTIDKYTLDIKNYRFNSAVAKLRELSNKLLKSKMEPTIFLISRGQSI